jgi:hypothetical protein
LVGADVGLHRNRHRPGDLSGGYLSEGWGLLVATSGDFSGHQRGHQLAITGDFLVATDKRTMNYLDENLQPDSSLRSRFRGTQVAIARSIDDLRLWTRRSMMSG